MSEMIRHARRTGIIRAALVVAAITMAAGATPTFAQPRSRTLEVSTGPLFIEGELVGCETTFMAAFPTRQNRLEDTFAGGSVTVLTTETNALLMGLKLTVVPDYEGDGVAPTSVYLLNGSSTNAADLVREMDAEPGFSLYSYAFNDQTLSAVVGIGLGWLNVGYTLPGDGIAQTFEVVIPAAEAAQFDECMVTLLTAVDARAGA